MKKTDAKALVMSVSIGSTAYSMGPDMGTELHFPCLFETRTLLHEQQVGPPPLSETGIDIDIDQSRKIFAIYSFFTPWLAT